MNNHRALAAASVALAAAVALLGFYLALLTLVSGWAFTLEQFALYWPFVIALAAGFGVQAGLFVHLRRLVHGAHGKVVALSGTTSTAAMVSCCAHYLANLLPVLGTAGLVSLVGQYQVELFWVGIAFNAAGIAYVGSKLVAATKEHTHCAPA